LNIASELACAQDLGEIAAHLTAREVHLKKAVARVHVALGAKQIVVVVCVDVRHTFPIEDHLDYALEARNLHDVAAVTATGRGRVGAGEE
jgi:hypothetical protein